MWRNPMVIAVSGGVLGLMIGGGAVGGLLPGRALGAEGTGSVAGWVYWSWCPPYPMAGAAGTGTGTAAPSGPVVVPGVGPDSGASPASPGGQGPTMPVVQPIPVNGALVALQGTSLAAKTDEEGFFMIDVVPVGTYYTIAASMPRRTSPPTAGSSGQPSAPTIAPFMCVSTAASRGNVVVSDNSRPVNVGALMLARFGPRPLGPGQQAPAGIDDGEGP